MAFTIEFSERARCDLHEIVQYIHRGSPTAAKRWRQKLLERLSILSSMALSFGLAPENELSRCEVRQLFFGWYRILYRSRQCGIHSHDPPRRTGICVCERIGRSRHDRVGPSSIRARRQILSRRPTATSFKRGTSTRSPHKWSCRVAVSRIDGQGPRHANYRGRHGGHPELFRFRQSTCA